MWWNLVRVQLPLTISVAQFNIIFDINRKPLQRYNISGVEEFAKEMEEKGLGSPKVSLQFELSSSGICQLIKAEAAVEETYTVEEEEEVDDDEAEEPAEEEKTEEEANDDEESKEGEEEKKEDEKPKKKKKTIKVEKVRTYSIMCAVSGLFWIYL